MTFKYYLSSYRKQNDTYNIRLKLDNSKNDVQYIDSKVSVLKTQWDSKRQRIKRHPLEEQLNAKLKNLIENVQSLYYKNPNVSASRLLKIYKSKSKYKSESFLDYYQDVIDEMRLKNKVRSANTNKVYVNKLKKFQKNIFFSDLDHHFFKQYELWMLKRGNRTNTIASNLKAIYATVNKAVKAGLIESNPLRGYTIKSENVEKQSLTMEQIEALYNMKIERRHKGMAKARDMFLFSFYCAGMRFSDVCRLKRSNIIGENIVYTMGKSKERAGSRRTIPLNPRSKEILARYRGKTYIFPILKGYDKKSLEEIEKRLYIQNNAVNRSLKIIGQKLGFGFNLSFHMAKHSFADYAVKNDVGILVLSKLLGHTKLSTTQHYLKDFYQKEQSDTMKNLFG